MSNKQEHNNLLFKKPISLKVAAVLGVAIPFVVLITIFAVGVPLTFFYLKEPNTILLVVLISVISVLFVLFGLTVYFGVKIALEVFYRGIYSVTKENYKNLTNSSKSLEKYTSNFVSINEVDELNKAIDELKVQLHDTEFLNFSNGYKNIPLDFLDKERNIVSLESFKENLVPIINSAQAFRNAVIEIYYQMDHDTLTKEETNRVISYAISLFKEYENVLYIINDDEKKGIYVYLPNFDTLSCLHEQLFTLMKTLSISKKTYDGLVTIPARFSLVAYPYSDVNEIFSDLRYAKRQGKVINFYIPNRLSDTANSKILQSSMSLNVMTKILKCLHDLPLSVADHESNLEKIETTFKLLAKHLNIDCAGIVSISNRHRGYDSIIHVENGNNTYFDRGKIVEYEILKVFSEVREEDGSYYFSTRKHTNPSLARILDKINITSGFYNMILDRGKLMGMCYFFNENGRELRINSYIREALYVVTSRLGEYILNIQREMTFSETFLEINSTLQASNTALYRVNPESYELTSFSQHMPTLFPNIKWGEKCYKVLYGLDAPCKDCPILTEKKKVSEIESGSRIETSLSVNVKNTYLRRMFIRLLENNEAVEDRFDRDLLINSYLSLVISMGNYYKVNSHGYLLLLNIDNLEELITKYGSEGALFLERGFLQRLKEKGIRRDNIFHFSNYTVAILLPEVGQANVVNIIESIYEASKEDYIYNETHNSFNITYLPIPYPMGYSTAEEFIKFAWKFKDSGNYASNKDFIYFADSDYSRSASRKRFMLSVIDDQFGNKTFSVLLQPMVKAGTKAIFGAELLLRIADDYRKIVFNADELVKVAAENGKISLISNALIEYIGNLYQQFGLTAFKVYGFHRLTINTDFSYFSDPNFFETIYSLINTYHFPKEFLGFEITEKEVFDHLDEFKKLSKSLHQRIALICDQYSGSFLSVDVLKELGFSEIKIGRYLVNGIDTDKNKYQTIKDLADVALSRGVKVALVGVENSDQYALLRDISKDIALQGYHFYKPLDKSTFIEALRQNK